MKRLFSFITAALLSLSLVHADVLFTEHFDRTLGTLSASTWSSGDLPKDGEWHTYSPGSVQFQVVDQQLKYTDYCSLTATHAAQYSANHSRDYILFDNAISSQAGNKAYLAFLLKAGGLQTTSGATSTSNASNSIISFAINPSNNTVGSLNGRVIIQTVDENTFKLGVSRRGETPQFADNQLKTGTIYLIVLEYAFISGEKNDLVSLFINPTPVEQSAAVVSVNPSAASADADQLVGVALCSNGNTPTDMILDEIRVATSWESLWEDSSQPTPLIIASESLDFGKVVIGEPAERSITIKGTDLQGAISVTSDNAALVPAVESIPQQSAADDYELKLTLTPTKLGEGSANIVLSSPGAVNHIIVVTWDAAKPVPPAGTELLGNPSFEEYSCNAMFGCSFNDWSFPIGTATAVSDDKLKGDVSLCITATQTVNLDQGVTLNDADYAAGTLFQLAIRYKVLTLPDESAIALDCYWEPAGGADAETMKQHDADVLQQEITTTVSTDWEELSVITSKPSSSTYFRVRVRVPKNAKVLFDDFSLVQIANTDPFITVRPGKLSPVETTIGNTATFQTLHIQQGNLTGTTLFELSYTDADQFSLSRSSLAADAEACDLIITYAPTRTGSHIAYLNIDNPNHTTLHQTIKLEAICTDPSAQPTITVTPAVVPDFAAVVGQQHKQTIKVRSDNCLDFIYLRVDHVEGAAFLIEGTMLSRNTESDVAIIFKPLDAGSFQSTLTIYSQSEEFEPVVLTLNGEASAASPETVDWQTDFVWDNSAPVSLLNEEFNSAEHNKTLLISGWQNVAAADQRPWWGIDESQTSNFDGNGRYAKATAYQFGKPSTGDWEMWLVTPALDFKNAESKLFAFSVMGEYLPEEEIQAALEIYYLDPYSAAEVFKQDLTASFSIPKTSDENRQWITFHLDLAPHAETIADVFHMAFRYVGPNGADGAVTYYIDNVSWGRTDLSPVSETLTDEATAPRRLIRDGRLLIVLPNGKQFNALGQRLL